jgi:hypothetical protein
VLAALPRPAAFFGGVAGKSGKFRLPAPRSFRCAGMRAAAAASRINTYYGKLFEVSGKSLR